MKFAAADLSDQSQKQRIIDIFVNSVYVYDDRVVIFFNYKDGERCVDFSVVEDSVRQEYAGNSNEKKTNTHTNECSPLIKSGDAARCADELFYVPGAFGVVVYL